MVANHVHDFPADIQKTYRRFVRWRSSHTGRPIACLAWSSAPRHLSARDRYIDWTPEARRRNLRLLAYNPRFLILPWVQVEHLASHILGQRARQLAGDWELFGCIAIVASHFFNGLLCSPARAEVQFDKLHGNWRREKEWCHPKPVG